MLLTSVGEEKLADQSGNRGRGQGRWWSLSLQGQRTREEGGGEGGGGGGSRMREQGRLHTVPGCPAGLSEAQHGDRRQAQLGKHRGAHGPPHGEAG